jgi:hypothetical protein
MSVVEALNKLTGRIRHNEGPKVVPGFLRPLDIKRIAQELNIAVLAAERGRKDAPSADEDTFDSVEQSIVQRIESECSWHGGEFIANLRAYATRLLGCSIPAEFANLQLSGQNALTRLRSASVQAAAELGPLREAYLAARNELQSFRVRHRLERPGLIGKAIPGADVLRSALAASNVTVLTSSMADQVSREDEKWQHGAFTKVFLDGLSSGDDIDTDRKGVISMAELTAYMAKHLDQLTGGEQQLGLEQRFQGDVFVSGL